jgi:hypothetical protein
MYWKFPGHYFCHRWPLAMTGRFVIKPIYTWSIPITTIPMMRSYRELAVVVMQATQDTGGGTISGCANQIPVTAFTGACFSFNTQSIPGDERSMKFFKIFPAAAGVIALTATVSFARDMRDMEDEDFSRVLIVSVNANADKDHAANNDGQRRHAYHVEINRGEKRWQVSIDAYTGKILDKRDITVATV